MSDMQNVAELLREALAESERQLAAWDTIAPLRQESILASLITHLNSPEMQHFADTTLTTAMAPGGIARVERQL